MKTIIRQIFFLCSLAISITTFGQQDAIDSLEQHLQNAETSWEKIDLHFGLGRLYSFNPNTIEKSRFHIDQLNVISEQENLPEAQAYALIIENLIAYIQLHDYEMAVGFCKRAMDIAEESQCNDAYAYAAYQLGERYISKGHLDLARTAFEAALKKQEQDFFIAQKTIGNIHKDLGALLTDIGEHDEGIEHLEKSIEIFEELLVNPDIDPRIGRTYSHFNPIKMQLIFALNIFGRCYWQHIGDATNGIYYKKKALEIAKDLPRIRGFVAQDISKIYIAIGDYSEGLNYLKQALVGYEEQNRVPDIAVSQMELGLLYIKMKDFNEAEKSLNKSLSYFQEKKDSISMANHYYGLLNIFLQTDRLDDAKNLVTEISPFINSIPDQTNLARFERWKGRILLEENNNEAAIKQFQLANSLFEVYKEKYWITRTYFDLARGYLKVLTYDSAIFYAKETLKFSSQLKDRQLTKDALQLISGIYEQLGNPSDALDYYKIYMDYYDSVYTADAQLRLRDEQVRQNVEGFKKEKELAEENAQLLSEQNSMYFIIGIALMVILGFISFLLISLRRVKLRVEAQNLQLKQLDQTKDKFFGIIAHDLRSPLLGLESIGEQIDYYVKNKKTQELQQLSSEIDGTTKKLTELLDNLLNWALLQNGMIPYHPETLELSDEVNAVMDLLRSFAKAKQIDLVNKIDGKIYIHADKKALNTILRNLLANAIKFTHAKGSITINVALDNQYTTIEINDTGTGISAELLPTLFELKEQRNTGTMGEKGSGLGLILCKELIELNNGSIKVLSELGKGSQFIFQLPTVKS